MNTPKIIERHRGFHVAEYAKGFRVYVFPEYFESENAAHQFIDDFLSATPETLFSKPDFEEQFHMVGDAYYDGRHTKLYKMDANTFVFAQSLSKDQIKLLYDNNATDPDFHYTLTRPT